MKKCRRCLRQLDELEFYHNRSTPDGLSWHCKRCHSVYAPDRKAERWRAYRRNWQHQHRDYFRETSRVAREFDRKFRPERIAARNAVARALASGKLTRGCCERCGAGNAQAHHEDYFKPLEVRWLCPIHHAQHHREKSPQGDTTAASASIHESDETERQRG